MGKCPLLPVILLGYTQHPDPVVTRDSWQHPQHTARIPALQGRVISYRAEAAGRSILPHTAVQVCWVSSQLPPGHAQPTNHSQLDSSAAQPTSKVDKKGP